jgi:hypothetical protein
VPLTTAVEVVVATAKAVEGWLGLEVAGRCSRGRHGSGLGGLQELGVPERSQLGRMVVAAATEVDRDSCCVYCGYFSIKEKIDISFLKRHRKRKGHYDNNKHKVFQDRMQCLIEGKEYYDIIDLMDNDDSSREE